MQSVQITEEMVEAGVTYLEHEYRYSERLLADASAFDIARLIAVVLRAGDHVVEVQKTLLDVS